MAMTHRSLLVIVAVLVVAAALGAVALWPSFGRVRQQVEPVSADRSLIDATIVDVEPVGPMDQPGLPPQARSVVLTARRADNGETVVFAAVDESGDLYHAGDRVRLERFDSPTEEGPATYGVADFRRGPALIAVAALLALAVVALTRWQGLRALLGLGLAFGVIVGFIVPALLSGQHPLAVALVGCVAIVVAMQYLSHGVKPPTTAAVVASAATLAVTVALGAWVVDLASLTGLAEQKARLANVQLGGISVQGLLLAGLVVGTLGVLSDVTMTQSATVFVLRRDDPGVGYRALVGRALEAGRDHVAATVNTLFLAYAGASLPLLIVFVTGPVAVGPAVTGEVVAVEVVRALVGSLGLVTAVPLTTLLAAALARGQPRDGVQPTEGEGGSLPAAGSSPGEDDPVGAALASPAPGADRGGGHAEPGDADQPDEPGQGHAEADADQWEQRLRRSYGLDDDSR
ncbi:MAG: YibE/F family protein [Actinobacteria bacterium QS_5_72_10]|nr:MAG: YibE/F family protein [Actinobacteria bacterium QS_5_72_10]